MALSRKQPSAGSSLEDHHEDSRPSKKTATSKYNVQSSEGLPFPKSGPVPVVAMILCFGEQEECDLGHGDGAGTRESTNILPSWK